MHALALRHVALRDGQALGALRPRDVVALLRTQLPAGRRLRAEDARPDTLAPTSVAAYVLRTLERFLQSADARVCAERHVPRQLAQHTDLRAADVAACAAALWELVCAGRTPRGAPVACPHDAYVKLFQLHGTAQPFAGYTALLLDEAQDLSACQAAVLLRARGACAVVVVGDVHQKIYGFRGGSAAAFHARTYPPSARYELTQSFRFGAGVARVASAVLALKAPPPWAPHAPPPRVDGTGADCVQAGAALPIARGAPHTRIYRTNALLAHDALRLAAAGATPLFLQTSQALQPAALAALLRDARTLYTGDAPLPPASALREFAAWKELVEHVEADDAGGDSKLALVVSLAPLLGAPEFPAHVDRLEQGCCAAPDAAAVVLTTVHQAKGLEWDTVVLADDFSPAHDACTPSLAPRVYTLAACDEINHMYVALTRARRRLVLPPGVHAWLVARDGLFRFRFAEKSARTPCPLCAAPRAALVALCEALAPADAAPVPRTRPAPFDAHVTPLGCLACVRARLGLDADLEDFVRWIDGSGASTTTGRLTPAAAARTAKRVRTARAPDAPTTPLAAAPDRAGMYAALLDEQKAAVRRWFDARAGWLAGAHAPEPAARAPGLEPMDTSL